MAKKNRTAIYNEAIRQFRKMGIDSNGKWRYESALNKVCFDLFGKKDVGTRLSPKSKLSKIEKCISSFDFDSLIGILADDKAAHKMSVAVMAKYALSTGNYSGKEMKSIKKAYKKIIYSLSDQFQIEKASDDILAELDRVTDDYDDYDFSDDDDIFSSVWEDDDGPFSRASRKYGKTAKHKNELARLLYGGSKYDEEDDEDEDDDDMTKIVDILENLTDRLDSLEDRFDGDDYEYDRPRNPRRRRSSRNFRNPVVNDGWEPVEDDYDDDDEEYYVDHCPGGYPPPPTPAEMSHMSSVNSMNTIMSAISEINTNVSGVSSALAETSRNVHAMQKDLVDTMNNVSRIMTDIYEDPPPEEPQYPIRDSDKATT